MATKKEVQQVVDRVVVPMAELLKGQDPSAPLTSAGHYMAELRPELEKQEKEEEAEKAVAKPKRRPQDPEVRAMATLGRLWDEMDKAAGTLDEAARRRVGSWLMSRGNDRARDLVLGPSLPPLQTSST